MDEKTLTTSSMREREDACKISRATMFGNRTDQMTLRVRAEMTNEDVIWLTGLTN